MTGVALVNTQRNHNCSVHQLVGIARSMQSKETELHSQLASVEGNRDELVYRLRACQESKKDFLQQLRERLVIESRAELSVLLDDVQPQLQAKCEAATERVQELERILSDPGRAIADLLKDNTSP